MATMEIEIVESQPEKDDAFANFDEKACDSSFVEHGPYWQMVYYAIVGFLFWAVLMVQIPFIDKYYGGPSVIFYLTFSYGLSSNVIRIVLIWLGNKAKGSMGSQMKGLVYTGSILTGLTMFGYPISMIVLGEDHPVVGFWICVILSIMMGFFNSLIMNVGFGLMSMAPEKSAGFFLLGQTMTGVVTWPLIILLRLIVSSLGGEENTDFIVAIFTLTFAGVVTLGLIPLYTYKTQFHPAFVQILQTTAPKSETGTMLKVFKQILVPAMCGWLSSVITFSVFPNQIGLWFPNPNAAYSTPVYRSFLLYLFSIADTIGRLIPRILPLVRKISKKPFVSGTVIRGLLVVPTFLLSTNKLPNFFGSDPFRLILILLFGISNGLNFSLANLLAPKLVATADKMHAGTVLSFVAVNGLFVGSMIGIGFSHCVTEYSTPPE